MSASSSFCHQGILYAFDASPAQLDELAKTLQHCLRIRYIDSHPGHHCLHIDAQQNMTGINQQLRPLAEQWSIDLAAMPAYQSAPIQQAGVLFMDMDSTLIQCECIDEIADILQIKKEVASITQRAMEGELDFSDSLRERIALLKGLPSSALEDVYQQRIHLTEGAEHLIQTLHAYGWKVGLVSGGFLYFASRLQERLQLDFIAANQLEIIHDQLTGRVLGRIVDGQEKCRLLKQQAKAWHIPLKHCIAIGDGANDLPMIHAAGMGVAFHAKPKVRAIAPYSLNSGGLDRLLVLLGAAP